MTTHAPAGDNTSTRYGPSASIPGINTQLLGGSKPNGFRALSKNVSQEDITIWASDGDNVENYLTGSSKPKSCDLILDHFGSIIASCMSGYLTRGFCVWEIDKNHPIMVGWKWLQKAGGHIVVIRGYDDVGGIGGRVIYNDPEKGRQVLRYSEFVANPEHKWISTLRMITDPTPPSQGGSPGEDAPDDNQSVALSDFPTPFILDPDAKSGVLTGALGEGMNCLIGKFNIATTMVYDDFELLGYSGRTINDLDVLCIGSGGLRAFESSPLLRKKLSDFVEQGGSLICLAAQNGYEFTALPGGKVAGYGWTENQSCLNSAVSIVKYHQMLSGQASTNIDVNVDGYFTKWPENATVLFQRNKNGMPALITYPYGKGAVIATTIFEDWAYGNNQSTASGQTLIREMVARVRGYAITRPFRVSLPRRTTIKST